MIDFILADQIRISSSRTGIGENRTATNPIPIMVFIFIVLPHLSVHLYRRNPEPNGFNSYPIYTYPYSVRLVFKL